MITITTQTGQIIPAEEVAKAEVQRQIAEYKAYLNSTDFYHLRQIETGEPVPQDVLDKRAEARAFIRANEVKD